MPFKAPEADTVSGKKSYDRFIQFKKGVMSSSSVLGADLTVYLMDSLYQFSRWTNDREEILGQRAAAFDNARKHNMPISQMSPVPPFTMVDALSFSGDSLYLLDFKYVKRLSLNFTPQTRSRRIRDLRIHTTGRFLGLYDYQPKGELIIDGACDTIILQGGKINKLQLTGVNNQLSIANVSIDSASSVILAANNKLSGIKGNGVIDLKTTITSDVNAVNITLNDIDLDHLRFPDYGVNFIVDPDTTQSYATKLRIYQQLVNHYADIPQKKKKYDVERIQLINKAEDNRLVDWIERHWNYYGYDKNLIFLNSAYLMGLCFLINLFFFGPLLINGYEIGEVKSAYEHFTRRDYSKWLRPFAYTFYCLVYTAFAFWGLNLKIDKIKLNNRGLFAWVIGQYIVGIICLAYIANIVITK